MTDHEHVHSDQHDPRCQCGGDIDAILARAREIIAENGWAVNGVLAGEHDGFVYTCGLSERGLPEIMITGLENVNLAASLLNRIAKIAADMPSVINEGYDAGGVEIALPPETGAPAPVWLLPVPTDHSACPFGVVHGLYGRGWVRGLTAVLPGDEGNYPWDTVGVPREQFARGLWDQMTSSEVDCWSWSCSSFS